MISPTNPKKDSISRFYYVLQGFSPVIFVPDTSRELKTTQAVMRVGGTPWGVLKPQGTCRRGWETGTKSFTVLEGGQVFCSVGGGLFGHVEGRERKTLKRRTQQACTWKPLSRCTLRCDRFSNRPCRAQVRMECLVRILIAVPVLILYMLEATCPNRWGWIFELTGSPTQCP